MQRRVRGGGGNGAARVDTPRPEAWGAALRLLTLRAHTTQEVRQRLARGGYPADEIEAVIARLTSAKYLDDLDFARTWVRSRATRRGFGAVRLARELRARGIGHAEIDAALAELPDESGIREAAEGVAARKLRALHGLPSAMACRRLAAHLTRQGFDPEVVLAVCRKHFPGLADPGSVLGHA